MDFIILNKYDFYHASSLCVKEELKKKNYNCLWRSLSQNEKDF